MGADRDFVEAQIKLLPRADLERLALSSLEMGAEVMTIVQDARDFGDEVTDDLIEYYEEKGLL